MQDRSNFIQSWDNYKIDPRYFVLLFLATFAIVGQMYLGFLQGIEAIVISIVTAFLSDVFLTKFFYGKWVFSLSAIITGLGISLLLSTHFLWVYPLTSILAISFKFIFRYKGGHIFNPNNVALVIVLVLLPDFAVSMPKQWSNGFDVMAIILLLGLFTVYMAKRLAVTLSFLGSFIAFGFVRHFVFGIPLLAALGPLLSSSLQLFAFFMITDPKTTPNNRNFGILFGVSVALIDAVFRVMRITNPQFYALFLACLIILIPYRWYHYNKMNNMQIPEVKIS